MKKPKHCQRADPNKRTHAFSVQHQKLSFSSFRWSATKPSKKTSSCQLTGRVKDIEGYWPSTVGSHKTIPALEAMKDQ
ncbi:hypothetical protein RBSH_06132 [Rhodopirellula baltica SH28]|uniref:Uncharacterized protein n=1 Tax=Rhodopirellula baltica SH28 TaxID=993517 RepID=K5D6Z1_RHOBT|nr:hypothetical protein RBSH_06132 [Rhodopirellula baltica SH28]